MDETEVRLLYRALMSEAKETKEPEKTTGIAEALAGMTVAVLAIVLIGSLLFWPWTTEGRIDRVVYNWNNDAIITFDDGRTLALKGQPSRSLVVGKQFRITYNNLKRFYSVEELEKD